MVLDREMSNEIRDIFEEWGIHFRDIDRGLFAKATASYDEEPQL